MEKDTKQNLTHPDDFIFRGQRSDEKIIFCIKQHPWMLAKRGFVVLICALIMIAAIAYFGASAITSWVIFLLLTFIICYSFYYWFLWWNGNLILTNQRVIQSVQNGLFSKKILEADLSKIQDAMCEIKGLSNSMLNIGSIQLQTASNEKVLRIEFIFNPYEIQQKITSAQSKYNVNRRREII